ncbi:DEAD/DEAH box helicase [Bacillus gobiensis]|uniref:DEAD/DEAH box helicase n=1 Tax=Bacillus gobiensis TaxID=1441095 RepID=UPI003D1DABC1
MERKKDVTELLNGLKEDDRFKDQIVYWHTTPKKEAKYKEMPAALNDRLIHALAKRGITRLYSHQYSAYEKTGNKENVVAVTPTASGKSLCYHLPVLQEIINDQSSRALYLFPTKALSQDQKSEMNELIEEIGIDIHSYTYDGDTSPAIRQKIRKAGHIVITNPDMLHSAILPHHTKWVSLFENLKFIIIDELHTYRGVFGSHVANVIRRLKRICSYYGSNPTFICTSATIANPLELAETLTGSKMNLISDNGAPSGKKHFLFYNPPIVNRSMNIRKSAALEVRTLAAELLKNQIQTIVFARSRVRVELILSYLQDIMRPIAGEPAVQGYRGGYLPTERRKIEKGLRSGDIMGVVSTNALELGVDIGQLQACIMTGYPGTIASAWQQSGRAGRRENEALIIMVASSTPLDQYIIKHPAYFFEQTPETAVIDPDNLVILVDHLKCAAFELPFKQNERFGQTEVEDILDYLREQEVLHLHDGTYHWMSDSFPAHGISLRAASQENVVIIDQSVPGKAAVIGEMDRFSAMTLLHEKAIYLHKGEQFQVELLDWEERKAYVREVQVDYFTDANLAVVLKVLEIDKLSEGEQKITGFGDITVNAKATIFKKIRFETHENIGSGPIHLPEEELHTNAAWVQATDHQAKKWSDLQMEQALLGAANILGYVAALQVMCDPSDLHVYPQLKAVHNEKPTIFIYDKYPGGVGLSKKIHEQLDRIIAESHRLVAECPCQTGCPSCIGVDSGGQKAKELVLRLLNDWKD